MSGDTSIHSREVHPSKTSYEMYETDGPMRTETSSAESLKAILGISDTASPTSMDVRALPRNTPS